MPYKPVFGGDFEYEFKWLNHKIIESENNTAYIGSGKRKDTARIIVKGPGNIEIPENIKVVMIERFLDTNILQIPKSVKALQIIGKSVKKFNLTIPHTVKELILSSVINLESWFDISKLYKIKSFTYSQAPNVKRIGKLPDNLEYLTLNNLGLKSIPKNLPISLARLSITHFDNPIKFPDLSYLTNLSFIGIEHTAISNFSKIPPLSKVYLYFLNIPQGSKEFPANYKLRPNSLRLFVEHPLYKVVNDKVIFQKT